MITPLRFTLLTNSLILLNDPRQGTIQTNSLKIIFAKPPRELFLASECLLVIILSYHANHTFYYNSLLAVILFYIPIIIISGNTFCGWIVFLRLRGYPSEIRTKKIITSDHGGFAGSLSPSTHSPPANSHSSDLVLLLENVLREEIVL